MTRPSPAIATVPLRTGMRLEDAGARTWRILDTAGADIGGGPAPLRNPGGLSEGAFANDVRAAARYALPWTADHKAGLVRDSLDGARPNPDAIRFQVVDALDALPLHSRSVARDLIDTIVANHNGLILTRYDAVATLRRVADIFADVQGRTLIVRDMRDHAIRPVATYPALFLIDVAPADLWQPGCQDAFAWYLAGLINIPTETGHDMLASQRYLRRMHARLDALKDKREADTE